ncbi:MAG: PDZ domain-containing protein, partial [Actinomycetota bacterium]|nr:PDZ domain-containing protein [Actinomycetota bacterium]
MRRRVVFPLLALLGGLLLLGGGVYLGGHPRLLPEAARDTLVGDDEAQLYQEAIDEIARDYYRPIDRRKLVDRSLEAAVRSLKDRFSNYFTPVDFAEFQQTTSGEFVGVGVSVQASERLRRGLRVLKVYDDSPAKRAGLRAGDLITKVDGRATAGESTEEVTARIKGPEG